jgi:hypothetical protein
VIRNLPTVVFFVMLAFPLAMTGVLVFVALRARERVRLMAATPTSHVGMARAGRCELSGRAEAIDGVTLRAPLTGAECCWWAARVEKYVRSGSDSSGAWQTLRDETSDAPFLLRDATGACVVLPYGAEVTATDHSVWYGSSPVPEDRSPKRFGPGESAEGMVRISTGGFRYREERIYAGDPLYALGDFLVDPWPADEDDEEPEEQAENAGPDESGASSEPEDAWSDDERLARLGTLAAALPPRRIARASRAPFLLSTTPEAKLAEMQQLGWKAALGIAAFPLALGGLLLWLRYG